MKEINAYLTFGGNCREAMQFYAKCTGGELFVMTFAEAPGNFPPEAKNLVMHAAIKKGEALLMASDAMPGMPLNVGNNVWVAIKCESADEVNQLYSAFSQGGKAVMPPGETFWAARFGMCTDKFDINWMFNFEKPRAA